MNNVENVEFTNLCMISDGNKVVVIDQVLKDIKKAGYSEMVLWVFRDNLRARAFYKANGFTLTGISKPAFDTEEVSKRI